jgi:hypothetical protein
MGLLSDSPTPEHSIRLIHSTSRWLRGRSGEVFWDNVNDSGEWDEGDERRSRSPYYAPGKGDVSRYTLPLEIRVRLGINWLRVNNLQEAIVSCFMLPKLIVDTI